MLNPRLFKAISVAFDQQPRVVNDNVMAEIQYPPPIISFLPVETPIHRSKIHGGEQYYINCPVCGDTRGRMNFSYLWNTRIDFGGCVYRCPTSLMNCYNASCQKDPDTRAWLIKSVNDALGSIQTLTSADICRPVESEEETDMVANQVPLPSNLHSIRDTAIPPYVTHYWINERGFTPDVLDRYGVKFTWLNYPIRKGASVMRQMVTVIPVYQNGEYWFYQLRLIPVNGIPSMGYELDMFGKQLPKYIIPHGSRKSWALYNIDKAMFKKTVFVVEGITDVWRIGPSAIARFGKTLSHAQLHQMKLKLAGKDIVLVPDMDDPQAMEEAIKQQIQLSQTGAFTGVFISTLPVGVDPGDLKGTEEEVCQILLSNINSRESNMTSLSGIQGSRY